MQPHSHSSSSSTSFYSHTSSLASFSSTTSPSSPSPPSSSLPPSPAPLLSSLDPVYRPPPSSTPPSSSSLTSGWLSYAETSLSGLSLDQEDARRHRVNARRRAMKDREEQRGTAACGGEDARPPSPVTLPTLPLSPPSPTPSLCTSRSISLPLSLRPSVGRQLWPSPAMRALEQPRRWDTPAVGSELSTGGERGGEGRVRRADSREGKGAGLFGISERQRLQMSHTLSLSPTPLELPEEDEEANDGAEVGERLVGVHPSRGLSLQSSTAVRPPSSRMSAVQYAAAPEAARSLFSSTSFPRPSSSPVVSANPLSAAILYVHSLVSTSPADVAGLRVRDFILEIGPYSKASGWEVNRIEDLARTIRTWPDTHPSQPLRVKALRRISPETAHTVPDVLWARTRANGNGDSGAHGNGKGGSGGGHGNGGGAEQVIALQPVVLWPQIGRWQLSEQQGGDGGGVLGVVLCNYPAPEPISPPSPSPTSAASTALSSAASSSSSASSSTSRSFHPAVGGPVTSSQSAASDRLPSLPASPRYTSSSYPTQPGSHLRDSQRRPAVARAQTTFEAVETSSRWPSTQGTAGASSRLAAVYTSTTAASTSFPSPSSSSPPSSSTGAPRAGSLYRHF